MAALFGVNIPAVSKHLQNIYEEGELSRDATVSILETVQTEGERTVKRNVDFYTLDAIISVGYRVSSARATHFRIWATGVVKFRLSLVVPKSAGRGSVAGHKVNSPFPRGEEIIPWGRAPEVSETDMDVGFTSRQPANAGSRGTRFGSCQGRQSAPPPAQTFPGDAPAA
nr:RhuM family protein [Aminivibrio sp.]